MKASVVDLRYNMHNVLKALDRNEKVSVMYRGKVRGVIVPKRTPRTDRMKVKDHPFFGSAKSQKQTVATVMTHLRSTRFP